MDSSHLTLRRVVAYNAVLALAYAVLGTLSLFLVRDTGLAAAVWPASGVAFAAVFVWGPRLLPGVFLGSFAVNIYALSSSAFSSTTIAIVICTMAIGATLQAFLGALLVRRFLGPKPALTKAKQVLWFMVLAGPIVCVINPTLGVLAQVATGVLEPHAMSMVWLTWWVGDSIGVIVFAPLTLMLFKEQRDVWDGRRLKVAIPSLLVLGLTIAAFLQYTSLQQQQSQLELEAAAQEVSSDMQRSLASHLEALQGISSLFESQRYVSKDEFAQYTKGMLERFPGIQAVSWNPVVPQSELATFTAKQRIALGMPTFEVFAKTADGTKVPAGPSALYVPVTYIEPLAKNIAAVGFDISSNPIRNEAVQRALQTTSPQMTAPIQLVQETGTQRGVLMMLPIYGSTNNASHVPQDPNNITGFAVGVYRLEDLLRDTFAQTRWSDASIHLIDVTPGAEPVHLAHLQPEPMENGHLADQHEELIASERFMAAGRVWELAIQPNDVAQSNANTAVAPAFLLGGLIISALLEAFLLLMTGMEKQARRRAELADYEAAHDPLTELLNRRALVGQLERARSAAMESGAPQVVMYIDLDGFKAVNDAAGHEAGDEMLRGISQALRERMRDGDTIARIGGDEFAVILRNCSSSRGVDVATGLIHAIESFTLERAEGSYSVSASVGVLEFVGPDVAEPEDLMHQADRACYEAKRAGHGRIRLAFSTEGERR